LSHAHGILWFLAQLIFWNISTAFGQISRVDHRFDLDHQADLLSVRSQLQVERYRMRAVALLAALKEQPARSAKDVLR
jgi:hypothetical protein